jgi:hypothetical protein
MEPNEGIGTWVSSWFLLSAAIVITRPEHQIFVFLTVILMILQCTI